MSKRFDYCSFSNIQKEKEPEKVKKAREFINKAEKCEYHCLKTTNKLVKEKIYWCSKINKGCNLGTCPLNK